MDRKLVVLDETQMSRQRDFEQKIRAIHERRGVNVVSAVALICTPE